MNFCRILRLQGFGSMENTSTGCGSDLPSILEILKNEQKSRSINSFSSGLICTQTVEWYLASLLESWLFENLDYADFETKNTFFKVSNKNVLKNTSSSGRSSGQRALPQAAPGVFFLYILKIVGFVQHILKTIQSMF